MKIPDVAFKIPDSLSKFHVFSRPGRVKNKIPGFNHFPGNMRTVMIRLIKCLKQFSYPAVLLAGKGGLLLLVIIVNPPPRKPSVGGNRALKRQITA